MSSFRHFLCSIDFSDASLVAVRTATCPVLTVRDDAIPLSPCPALRIKNGHVVCEGATQGKQATTQPVAAELDHPEPDASALYRCPADSPPDSLKLVARPAA